LGSSEAIALAQPLVEKRCCFFAERASFNQLLAVVGALIDQFSILTKAINSVFCGSQQYNFTQTYQLYLFLVELKN
jgi:hypothetical protein